MVIADRWWSGAGYDRSRSCLSVTPLVPTPPSCLIHTTLSPMASSQNIANEKDVFFLERLDAFIDKTLLDAMKSFAIREERPLEQVRTGTRFIQLPIGGLSSEGH